MKANLEGLPLKAYITKDRTGQQDCSNVVYARSRNEARKNSPLISEHGMVYMDVGAYREPKLDGYMDLSDEQFIRKLLELGWWQTCAVCNRQVYLDTWGAIVGNKVYCQECENVRPVREHNHG